MKDDMEMEPFEYQRFEELLHAIVKDVYAHITSNYGNQFDSIIALNDSNIVLKIESIKLKIA